MASSDEFYFPYDPYYTQTIFMKKLHETLSTGQIGIFESPTGTGKSLSLLCASLKWLQDFTSNRKSELKNILEQESVDKDDVNWFDNFPKVQEQKENKHAAQEELNFMDRRRHRIEEFLKERVKTARQKHFFANAGIGSFKCPPEIPELDDDNCAAEDKFFLVDNDPDDDLNQDSVNEPPRQGMKIYYASRTHSQLAQFMNEFRKTKYANEVSMTCLGSRTTMCVNDDVNKLKSYSLVNEKCKELIDSKRDKNAQCGCQYYNIANMKHLEEEILIKVCDIEDLKSLGKEVKACPYYTTRRIMSDVEVVLIPYNILLHKPTRETYGIQLKDNIVIVDEAHNLLDAINKMYEAEVNCATLQDARTILAHYVSRYNNMFSAKTVFYLKQLKFVLDEWIKYLNVIEQLEHPEVGNRILQHNEFLFQTSISHINVFELVQFCENSHIGYKLFGFARSWNAKAATANIKSQLPTTPIGKFLGKMAPVQFSTPLQLQTVEAAFTPISPDAFLKFYEFLKTLTLPVTCGQYIMKRTDHIPNVQLKFLHLNASVHFQDIVANVRSLILAGGTMSPINEFRDQLLIPAGAKIEKIVHYCFEHVVPSRNVVVLPISSGPNNQTLDFRYNTRNSILLLKELGDILTILAGIVPGGIVCFFQSYAYEEETHSFLSEKGFMKAIEKHKNVFRESRNEAHSDPLLARYISAVKANPKKGAILFGVINGKMSEGINFSDDLCRCVVVVGMPYPMMTLELQLKISYCLQFYETKENYLQSQCMKAVNQSIGRAIRHKRDYAAIVLLDARYSQASTQAFFPTWISKGIYEGITFERSMTKIQKFFGDQ